MPLTILVNLLVLVGAALVGGILLKSIKQPPIIGYLLAGVVLGILFGSTITSETVAFLSELGIILLLFTLGLEFSLTRLKKVAKVAVWGALLQIILTVVLSTLVIHLLNFSLFHAFFMAAAFSLSSTAIVVKLLSDRGELDSLPGEIMVAWLVVQDLAVLPMIVLLPTFGKIAQSGIVTGEVIVDLGKNLVVATVVLGGVLLAGKKVVPLFISGVASYNSRELLLVSVFGTAVAGALLTQVLGLSAALGAFLAGLLIAESTQQYAVFSEVRPLRDLFVLMFFATLGLLLPSGFIFAHFPQILLITVFVVALKFLVVGILSLYLGVHAKTSFIISIGLIEVGEFAFVLSKVGLDGGAIDETVYGMILSVALLSILVMPPLFLAAPALYTRLKRYTKHKMNPLYIRFFGQYEHKDLLEQLPYKNHVVLCGYGRVGRYVGRALEMEKIPYIVIEYNQHKAESLKAKGLKVVYGDPSDIDILDYAQVDFAKAVVVAIPDFHTQQQVIANSLTLNKDVQIYCRTHHEEDQAQLKSFGVAAVIQPEFEAALSITDKLLKTFGTKPKDIEGKVTRLKIEHGLA